MDAGILKFREELYQRLRHLLTDEEARQDIEDLADFCYGYLFTNEMVAYIESHPDADRKELWRYFDETVPDGLAPGDDGLDLLEDD